MIFNPSLKTSKSLSEFKLKVTQDHELKQVEQLTYLGVKVYSQLSWEPHIRQLCKNLDQTCGMMRKIKPMVNFKFLKSLYYYMALTHVKYGILSWINAEKTLTDALNKIHDKIINVYACNASFLLKPRIHLAPTHCLLYCKLVLHHQTWYFLFHFVNAK